MRHEGTTRQFSCGVLKGFAVQSVVHPTGMEKEACEKSSHALDVKLGAMTAP